MLSVILMDVLTRISIYGVVISHNRVLITIDLQVKPTFDNKQHPIWNCYTELIIRSDIMLSFSLLDIFTRVFTYGVVISHNIVLIIIDLQVKPTFDNKQHLF